MTDDHVLIIQPATDASGLKIAIQLLGKFLISMTVTDKARVVSVYDRRVKQGGDYINEFI